MKKIAYLIIASSLVSNSLLHAGPLSHMKNVPHWTGFTMGINGGYWWSENNTFQTTGVPSANTILLNPDLNPAYSSAATFRTSAHPQGLIGGFQIGYNYELAYKYLFGVEADIDALTQSENTATSKSTIKLKGIPSSIESATSITKSMRFLGSARARLGYMVTPAWTAYGTGGLALGPASLKAGIEAQFTGDPSLNKSITKSGAVTILLGWTAGAGVEWMFQKNWIAGIEFLYYDLGSLTKSATSTQYSYAVTPPAAYTQSHVTISVPFTLATFRARCVYRFDSFA